MNLLHFTIAISLALTTIPAQADDIRFGDNKSEWANDQECDDRRFYGTGMANELDNADTGRDANDCRKLFNAGKIKLWIEGEAKAATQCSKIDFGDDKSEYAKDDECDDARFEGRGMSSVVVTEDVGHDAADCKASCQNGLIFLRNY